MAKLECQTLCSAAILRSGSFWSAFWGLFPLPIGCAAAFGAEHLTLRFRFDIYCRVDTSNRRFSDVQPVLCVDESTLEELSKPCSSSLFVYELNEGPRLTVHKQQGLGGEMVRTLSVDKESIRARAPPFLTATRTPAAGTAERDNRIGEEATRKEAIEKIRDEKDYENDESDGEEKNER
jgi:hypothetical protein